MSVAPGSSPRRIVYAHHVSREAISSLMRADLSEPADYPGFRAAAECALRNMSKGCVGWEFNATLDPWSCLVLFTMTERTENDQCPNST